MKVQGLQELGKLRDRLREHKAREAEERARQAAEAARVEAERLFFAHSVGSVQPVRGPRQEPPSKPAPTPEPRQREADEAAALQEALSDEVDVESLLLTDDGLSYRRPNIGSEVLTRLRRGHWSIQGELDLHGLRRDEARTALADFIRLAFAQSRRCLRVVHGKGHGSPGREPVLKAKVHRWLAQRNEVIAFTQAAGPQGGAGALIVLLGSRLPPGPGAGKAQRPPRDDTTAAVAKPTATSFADSSPTT